MTIWLYILFAFTVVSVFLEDYLKDRDKLCIYIAIVTSMLVFAAMRDVTTTPDSDAYEEMFYGKSNIFAHFVEPTFTLIADIVRFLGYGVGAIFLIYAIINIVTKGFLIYKISMFPLTAVCAYMSHQYLLHDMIQIRAGAAAAFLFMAVYYIIKEKKIYAAIAIGVAILFHFSAALGLVLLFYNNKPLDNLRMWILRCVLPVGLLLYAIKFNVFSIIPGFIGGFKMEVYKSQAETGMMSSASLVDDPLILLRMFVFGYTLYFYNTIKEYTEYAPILLKVMGTSLFIFLMFSCTNRIFAYRLSELLYIADPIVMTFMIYTIRPAWVGKTIIVAANAAVILWCVKVLQYVQ